MPQQRLLVTRAELGRLLGASASTISRATAAGMPERRRGGGPGRPAQYDAVHCLSWWRRNQLEGPTTNGASPRDDYLRALTRRVEQDLAVRRGELVARDAVILAGQGYTKAWAAKVQYLPHRLVEVGLITREQFEAVRALCRELLTEIASWKTIVHTRRAARNMKARKR